MKRKSTYKCPKKLCANGVLIGDGDSMTLVCNKCGLTTKREFVGKVKK